MRTASEIVDVDFVPIVAVRFVLFFFISSVIVSYPRCLGLAFVWRKWRRVASPDAVEVSTEFRLRKRKCWPQDRRRRWHSFNKASDSPCSWFFYGLTDRFYVHRWPHPAPSTAVTKMFVVDETEPEGGQLALKCVFFSLFGRCLSTFPHLTSQSGPSPFSLFLQCRDRTAVRTPRCHHPARSECPRSLRPRRGDRQVRITLNSALEWITTKLVRFKPLFTRLYWA